MGVMTTMARKKKVWKTINDMFMNKWEKVDKVGE
jgi:hypothetical protein